MTEDDTGRCDTLPDGPPVDVAQWLRREISSGCFTRDELLRLMGFFIKATGLRSLTLTTTVSINGEAAQLLDTLDVSG